MNARTRFWHDPDPCGSATAVQFRTDGAGSVSPVWLHTNLGWVPVGNAPRDEGEAEAWAVDLAEGYGLVEASAEYAEYMAGWTPDEGDARYKEARK